MKNPSRVLSCWPSVCGLLQNDDGLHVAQSIGMAWADVR
jgi:hypothetical protein